jgi:cytoskeletal protein RodZ
MGFSRTFLPNLPVLRQQKGISLDAIATETRIGIRDLEAIEQGAFTRLPGGIYDTSYIRQYARAVDFDEQELLDCYWAAVRPSPPPPPAEADGSRSLSFVSTFKLRKT